MPGRRLRSAITGVGGTVAILLSLALPLASAVEDERRTRALALYDQGRCQDAQPLLESLDAEGQLAGPLLYRLAFCQRAVADPRAPATQQRAVLSLEQELSGGAGLEVAFYLANSYENLGRHEDSRKVAEATAQRVESGQLAEPTLGMDMFRMGKLYADLGRKPQAVEWYGKALQAFSGTESENRVYVEWARRYLGDGATDGDDPATTEAHYGSLAESGKASATELDRLAIARTRLGRYAEARDAWRQAERVDPANADRARYSWRMADMAAQMEQLPEVDPQGRPWRELSRADLETLISAQAATLRQTQLEAQQATRLKKKKRKELEARVATAKALFVAAGLDYTARGHSLQEVAFTGGYAPLIFHPDEWQLPVAE